MISLKWRRENQTKQVNHTIFIDFAMNFQTLNIDALKHMGVIPNLEVRNYK